jgi:hypothetical protein
MLQIIQQLVVGRRLDLCPAVNFGPPMQMEDLLGTETTPSSKAVMSAVLGQARQVLKRYQAGLLSGVEISIPA